MTKRCVILSAGDFSPSDYRYHENDYVIAADGGYAYLKSMGITPDLCIGDFDSLGFVPKDCKIAALPVEKDCTDTDAAIRAGLAEGCVEFLLVGMLGGKRLSHTVANLQSLSLLAEKHVTHKLVGNGITVRALAANDSVCFSENDAYHVSVLAITDTASVSLQGLHYIGKALTITNRFPLGVSNETIGQEATVTCHEGMVLVITEEKG